MAADTGTTSAPSPAARARTASRCGLPSKPSSSTLATYITGFRVIRNRSRTAALSSSDRPSERADLPSLRPALMRPSTSARALASLSPVLAARSARCRALSPDSRSASASSVSMVSISAIGSMRLDTWITSSFSKQRTTCVIASTSRMWARNLLPRPSPLAAPATRPAMSTNSTAVGMTFCGLTMSDSALRRGSGTGTTPTFGSIVQKGKLAAAMPALVSALNRVDLPTFGRPTMPHLMPMVSPGRSARGRTGVEALGRLVDVARDRQRQDRFGVVDRAENRGLVVAAGLAQHPRRDLVLVARMADADPQPVEPAMAQQAHGVAQPVLAAVAAIELEAGGARREVELVVRQQRFFRLDLPVAQRGGDRLAAEVHEGRRLEQPDRLPRDLDLGRLAEQLGFQPEAAAEAVHQGVNKPEPGVVPGPGVFGTGVSQPDDEAQASHADAPRRAGRAGASAGAYFFSSSFLATFAAGTSAAAGASVGSSTSSLPCLAMTIATSCSLPSFSSGISTPSGSFSSERWTMSPTLRSDRSTSMNSGRYFGRQLTSTSLSSCVTTTSADLPAGDFSSLRKCSGTSTRIAWFSSTRWKSRCMMICLYGWRCMSRSSTFCTLPSRSRSRIDE